MIGGAAPKGKSGDGNGNVVLNLVNVPLQQAAKTVLADMIGVNYVVDPRVDGVISVQTTQPVGKAEALELFQSALAPIGAVLVQNRMASTGSRRPTRPRLVPSPPAPIRWRAPPRATAVRVVSLKYVSASELARVLEPMVPRGAIVRSDDTRNIVALKGTPSEIDSMLDTISVFDVDVMRGMSFAVVPVKTAQPNKMVDELKAVFSSDKEGPMKGPGPVHRQQPARRYPGRDIAAKLFAPRPDLDPPPRCPRGWLRATAPCLSGAEPAGRRARQRPAVDVCERDEGHPSADPKRLAEVEGNELQPTPRRHRSGPGGAAADPNQNPPAGAIRGADAAAISIVSPAR